MKYVAYILIAATVAFVATAVLVFLPERVPDDVRVQIAKLCLGVVASEERVGFEAQLEKSGALNFDIGGSSETKGSNDPVVVEKVTACIAEGYSSNNEAKNTFVSTSALPIGQIADEWSDSNFRITFEGAPDLEALKSIKNIRFPAAAGPKPAVMRDWCQSNASCIVCTPSPEISSGEFPESATIAVSLDKDARLERVVMSEGWSNPKDIWEDVDENGTRFLRVCSE